MQYSASIFPVSASMTTALGAQVLVPCILTANQDRPFLASQMRSRPRRCDRCCWSPGAPDPASKVRGPLLHQGVNAAHYPDHLYLPALPFKEGLKLRGREGGSRSPRKAPPIILLTPSESDPDSCGRRYCTHTEWRSGVHRT